MIGRLRVEAESAAQPVALVRAAAPGVRGHFFAVLNCRLEFAAQDAALGPPLAAVGVRDQGHGGGAQCIRLLFQVPENEFSTSMTGAEDPALLRRARSALRDRSAKIRVWFAELACCKTLENSGPQLKLAN